MIWRFILSITFAIKTHFSHPTCG